MRLVRSPPSALAEHVRACDVLVQPYPDGISSRRTSAMAGLALGVAVVTTTRPSHGALLGRDRLRRARERERAARLAAEALRLLSDDARGSDLAARGRDVYAGSSICHTPLARSVARAQEPCASPS